MAWIERGVAAVVRLIVWVGLNVYFGRVERYHIDRVPKVGPVLFASNHPGSITDAFLIGTALKRRVSFVGTVQLFRWRPLAWLLGACGIIPVNRVKDDPRAMRTVLETFEACYRELERGGAVGIFPEGVTYNDALMRPLKSGTSRMALELEQRHAGGLGLMVLPVGISYSGKHRYRSRVLLHFGEPLRVKDWLEEYGSDRKATIQRFSGAIEQRIQELILHLPDLAEARLVKAVFGLYHDCPQRAGLAGLTESEALMSHQRIATWVRHYRQTEPARVAQFVARLDRYRRHLRRLQLLDPALLRMSQSKSESRARRWTRIILALAGLPVALYGWVHRMLPFLFVDWAVRRFTVKGARKAQTPHVTMIAGVVGFGVAYGIYVGLVQWIWGWPGSGIYAVSLPVSGLYAHGYWGQVGHLPVWIRAWVVRVRSPWIVRRVMWEREILIREIERAREEVLGTGEGGVQPQQIDGERVVL